MQPTSALTFDGSGYLFVPMFFNETGISNPNNFIGERFILRAQSFKRSLIAFMYDQKVGDMGVYLGAMGMELGQVIDLGAMSMELGQVIDLGAMSMELGQVIDLGAMGMELGQIIDPGAVGMEREQGAVDMKWGQGIDCGPWVWLGAG